MSELITKQNIEFNFEDKEDFKNFSLLKEFKHIVKYINEENTDNREIADILIMFNPEIYLKLKSNLKTWTRLLQAVEQYPDITRKLKQEDIPPLTENIQNELEVCRKIFQVNKLIWKNLPIELKLNKDVLKIALIENVEIELGEEKKVIKLIKSNHQIFTDYLNYLYKGLRITNNPLNVMEARYIKSRLEAIKKNLDSVKINPFTTEESFIYFMNNFRGEILECICDFFSENKMFKQEVEPLLEKSLINTDYRYQIRDYLLNKNLSESMKNKENKSKIKI